MIIWEVCCGTCKHFKQDKCKKRGINVAKDTYLCCENYRHKRNK